MRRRPVFPILVLLAAAVTVGACGGEEEKKTGLIEGEPVELGELRWNVLFSRFLNPNDAEDRAYLLDQPPPPRDASYLGVFVEVENEDDEGGHELPAELVVEDTVGNEYKSLESESPYALRAGSTVAAGDEVPALDSTPQVGPIQGAMILFLIPDEAFENRPLELTIPGDDGPATVELDL
jgi:hypothetical protein